MTTAVLLRSGMMGNYHVPFCRAVEGMTLSLTLIPACGTRLKKTLSTRTHACKCGYIEDRDIAASINILKKGLNTVGHTGIYAWGETPSWAIGSGLSSNGDSANQESPVKI